MTLSSRYELLINFVNFTDLAHLIIPLVDVLGFSASDLAFAIQQGHHCEYLNVDNNIRHSHLISEHVVELGQFGLQYLEQVVEELSDIGLMQSFALIVRALLESSGAHNVICDCSCAGSED
jgi:hypothetical protein